MDDTAEGLVIAQFQRVEPAEEAAKGIPSATVVVAADPKLEKLLAERGLSATVARTTREMIDPSAVVLLARAPRGEQLQADLRCLWDLGGGSFIYVPLEGEDSTTRSSPKDQSAKNSSSTSR